MNPPEAGVLFVLRRLARGRRRRLVWGNELGGVTYEVGTNEDRCS